MSKKRGHGEGCITKRKDDKWAAVITVGRNDDGTLKRRFIYGKHVRKSLKSSIVL